MSQKYAKVVAPEGYDVVLYNLDGHTDSFEGFMDVSYVIRVEKHPEYPKWYLGYLEDGSDYNYHESWLKFVRKPRTRKGNK